MRNRYCLLVTCILVVGLLAGCQTATPEPEATPTEAPPPAEPILEIVPLEGSPVVLTMDEIQAMPLAEGWSGIKTSTGDIHVPEWFQAVRMADLLEAVGGLPEDTGVNVVAEDGYAISFSSEQILNGDFITYDPATGDEITIEDTLQLGLAYGRDGQPLDEASEGALRIVVLSPENNVVVDGHWSVKWVNRIELVPLASVWTVHLEGGIVEDLDQGSFESCAAPSCHHAEWTDEDGQVWSGVPLWLILGRADDEVQHGDGAFNEALAALGYPVDIVASDGYTVTLESSALARDNGILLANLVNGEPLAEDQAPLRLVGDDLARSQRVSMIAQILLQLGEVTAPAAAGGVPPLGPGEEVALTVTGAVAQELTISLEGLRSMGPVTIDAEHPRSGMQTYEGLRLSALLEAAGLQEGATNLAIVASDGYRVDVSLTDLEACADCMLAFSDEGELNAIMPGFPGNLWNKGVITLLVE